ncbi:toll/interleukin-1 receptor domain-containing protein [Novosphingobium clariflavum]|uniref:Toll/interleukin-1 receptor domain-containing protein n=1 Tax=Novosphingobium clariflavum TaxID=2029884 RepID=A0ABV6S453_9SPHN|nr:toll/interleukin-1 receptor domain-containing protein [Novosphingobium clariflavum]
MSAKPLYHIVFLGDLDDRRTRICEAVLLRADGLGLDRGAIGFLGADDVMERNLVVPAVGIFLGSPSFAKDTDEVTELIEQSIPIAPIVSSVEAVAEEIPPQLRHVNALPLDADGTGVERMASLVFETFRLLRGERRLFISYKRKDSQALADRLYDELDKRGFDVFIDTRAVPPAADFQSVLWHRMSDADVVVLIDTEGFRDSRWTVEELTKANATNIQILHILWPGQPEDKESAFSHFFPLENADFVDGKPAKGESIADETVVRICEQAEALRARAIAARHAYLVDSFCDAARDVGLAPAVQPERYISLPTGNGRALAVVPVVGLPTSMRINEIFEAIDDAGATRDRWIVFDNRGLLDVWLKHLDWLNGHLPVRAVWVSKTPDQLKGLV